MEYPVYLKRKRMGMVILNAVILAVSIAAAVFFGLTGEEYVVFIIIAALLAVTLVFNIIIAVEKTYAIYSDRIVTLSRFLPKFEIKAEELAGVTYLSEARDTLKISYNTDEFDLEKLSGGSSAFAELGEGMWTSYISRKDVDRPLEEVKYLIESIKK